MTLTGLEKTAIVIIVILVYYVIMMVISIILAKTNHPTAARWIKTLSILNYPFKKLNEHSIHIDNDNKYGTIAKTYVVKEMLGVIGSTDLGQKLIEEQARSSQSTSQPTSQPTPQPTSESTPQSTPNQQIATEETATESNIF